MKDESTVQQEVQRDSMHYQTTLMRNNNGACLDDTGRLVRYGLGHTSKKQNERIKSSDLIGIKKVLITQEMVGQTIGQFVALEVKKEAWNPDKKLDKRETAQHNFMLWVRSLGGRAEFINSLDKLQDVLT